MSAVVPVVPATVPIFLPTALAPVVAIVDHAPSQGLQDSQTEQKYDDTFE
jgi:hypothetical protein